VPLWSPLLLFFAGAAGLVAYHARLSRAVRWFSPGEIIFGRLNHEGTKWWVNPYRVSRAYMFTLVIVALVWWGNLWDSVADERFYSTMTFPVVLGRIGLLALGLYGLLLLGRGKPHGAYFVAAVFALSALGHLHGGAAPEVPRPITTGLAAAGVAMVLFAVGAGLYYARHVEASDRGTASKGPMSSLPDEHSGSSGEPTSRMRLIAVVLGVAADVGASTIASGVLTYALLPRGTSIAGMAEHTMDLLDNIVYAVGTLLLGTAGTILGGFVAGLLAKGAEVKSALVVGAIGVLLAVFIAAATPGLLAHWYTIVALLATLPAAWVGGWFAARRA
jgi:hypothetical protein